MSNAEFTLLAGAIVAAMIFMVWLHHRHVRRQRRLAAAYRKEIAFCESVYEQFKDHPAMRRVADEHRERAQLLRQSAASMYGINFEDQP